MQKKILSISIIGTLLLLFVIVGHKAQKMKEILPEAKKTVIAELPDFSFVDVNSRESLSNLDLETGISTIIVHFSPTCDFCDQEAQIFMNYSHEFQNSQILFVSNHNEKSIRKFQEKHHLTNLPNIYFLQYQKDQFNDLFGTHKLPSIFVFDTQFKLLKKIEEAVSAKTVVKYTRAANDR